MQDPRATEKCTFCLQLYSMFGIRPALSPPNGPALRACRMGSMFSGINPTNRMAREKLLQCFKRTVAIPEGHVPDTWN